MSNVYLVADADMNVATIQLKLFGRVVLMPAIFNEEQDALEFLWAAQSCLSRPHQVIPVNNLMESVR